MVVNPPRYTPLTGSLKRAPSTPASAATPGPVNPVALKDYIEKVIHPELESRKIAITHLKSDTYFRQYRLERDGKNTRLHYGFNGNGFFSDFKVLPGGEPALEEEILQVLAKYA